MAAGKDRKSRGAEEAPAPQPLTLQSGKGLAVVGVVALALAAAGGAAGFLAGPPADRRAAPAPGRGPNEWVPVGEAHAVKYIGNGPNRERKEVRVDLAVEAGPGPSGNPATTKAMLVSDLPRIRACVISLLDEVTYEQMTTQGFVAWFEREAAARLSATFPANSIADVRLLLKRV
ncbi:MAG: hypothetical protein HY719_03090 [Planctomycetes bacterium]|nr:hypothetical protein [Planctomycetota bacterium]